MHVEVLPLQTNQTIKKKLEENTSPIAAMYCTVPASEHGVEGDDEVLLLLGEVLVLEVGAQVVGVPQPAALAAPLQPCNHAHHTLVYFPISLISSKPSKKDDDLLSGARWSSCRCHGWRCRPAAWRPPPASTAPSSRSPCRSTAASPSTSLFLSPLTLSPPNPLPPCASSGE